MIVQSQQKPDVKINSSSLGGEESAGDNNLPLSPGYSDSGKAEEYSPVDIDDVDMFIEQLDVNHKDPFFFTDDTVIKSYEDSQKSHFASSKV